MLPAMAGSSTPNSARNKDAVPHAIATRMITQCESLGLRIRTPQRRHRAALASEEIKYRRVEGDFPTCKILSGCRGSRQR